MSEAYKCNTFNINKLDGEHTHDLNLFDIYVVLYTIVQLEEVWVNNVSSLMQS